MVFLFASEFLDNASAIPYLGEAHQIGWYLFSMVTFKHDMDAIVQRAKAMLESVDDGRVVVDWLRREFDKPDARAARGLSDTRSVSSLHYMMTLP